MSSKEIPVLIHSVTSIEHDEDFVSWVIVLEQPETKRIVPIPTDFFTAGIIEETLRLNPDINRSIHAMCIQLLALAKANIEKVVINSIQEKKHFADVYMKTSGGSCEIIDALSDNAIALAILADAPLYIAEELFQYYENNASKEVQESFHQYVEDSSVDDGNGN